MSIIPNTTASMITAPSTAFGRSENSGASTSRVAITSPPVDERGDRRSRARRLVQRTGREAGRHRHPLEHAGADVRHALRHGLLIDVDAIAMAGGERPGIARGLGEPDQQQRDRRDHHRRVVVRATGRGRGSRGSGSPRGTSPTSATPCAPRSKTAEATSPPPRGPARRERRAREAQSEDHRERADPDEERRRVHDRRATPATTRARATRCHPRPTCRSASATRR